MPTSDIHADAATDCTPCCAGRPYSIGLVAIIAAWMLGVTTCWLAELMDWIQLEPSLAVVVSIGSGLTAVAAALPGVWVEHREAFGIRRERLTLGFSLGFAIRMAGTVALVGLCSYHMPAAKKQIAALVLGWYIYLTAVDVCVLSVLFPRLDRVPVEINHSPVSNS